MTPKKLLGLLLVVVYIVALKVLAVLDIRDVFEHRLLLPVLNTLFAGIVPIAVAYVASKAYVKGGSVTILCMGCGMLSFGLSAISAGWLIRAADGANLNVTVYNTGAFCGSVFHATGAMLALIGTGYSDDIRRRRLRVVLVYVGVTVFLMCFFLAALRGLVPRFFIQGVGPTDLRQAILGTAVLLYLASSIFLMAYYFKWKSDFLYWYSLCLSMIAIGLFAFFVQTSVGCPIGWLGRSANYVGGIFAFVAILGALRDARVKGMSLESAIADGFETRGVSYPRGLLPVLPIPIFFVLLVILVPMNLRTVFEPPGLFAALNTLFLCILPLTVVYLATKGYLQRGLLTTLMLGSGTLILGLGSLSSGWVMTLENGGPNASATIFNVTLLLSAICQLLGGLLVFIGVHLNKDTRRNNLVVACTYLGIAVLLGFLTHMILQNRLPVFFIQSGGPTAFRQSILGTAAVLFIISGFLLAGTYFLSGAKILYWYALSLFLFATGAISLMFAHSVGSPIAWLGRSGVYLAGTYLFIAVTSAARDLHVRGESLETGIANLFRHHLESLVEERTLQLSLAKEELQTAQNELQRANSELEQGVLDRTAKLEQANKRLQEEIEERERAEGACFAASTYNRSLIEASLDPLVTISADGKITDVNTATERVTGYSRTELIGTDFANYFTNTDKAKFGYEEVFRAGSVKNYELAIRHKGGRVTPVMYNASIYRDDSGKVVGIFAAARDITDRKRAEADLMRSNQDLQQFAYVASHDLQEPLRNVVSCLQMLEKKYKSSLNAEADQYIQYAVEGALRMKALIQDLLAYSRIGTKAKPPEPTDSEQILAETTKNLRSAITESEAIITHDSLPTIPADDTQLLQVFQNLIGNAIKFRRDESPQIHVSAVQDNDEWVFSVKDNGIGIESRHLDRIFVIFQRLQKRSLYEGTGMGLAIVKKIVERHRGRVWVESQLGVGTTFYFTMPNKRVKP